jgi:hypothetical protein
MCLLPMTDVCTNLEGVDEEGISWSMYDGDGWVDVGVGASHHSEESHAEVDLQECVDIGQEHDGLDHNGSLLSACTFQTANDEA